MKGKKHTYRIEFPDGQVVEGVSSSRDAKRIIEKHLLTNVPKIKLTNITTNRSFTPTLKLERIRLGGDLATQMHLSGVDRTPENYVPVIFRTVYNTLVDIQLVGGTAVLTGWTDKHNKLKLVEAGYVSETQDVNTVAITDKGKAFLDKVKAIPANKLTIDAQDASTILRGLHTPGYLKQQYTQTYWNNIAKRWVYNGLLEPDNQTYKITDKGLKVIQRYIRPIIKEMITNRTKYASRWNEPVDKVFDKPTQQGHKVLLGLVPKETWSTILSESDNMAVTYMKKLAGLETANTNS